MVGCDDLIVVHTDDATLVCPRSKAQQIKDVIAYYKTGWEEWDRTGEYASWMFYE